MKTQSLFLSALLVLVLFGATNLAAASDAKWIIRGNYVVTWPDADSYDTSLPPNAPEVLSSRINIDSGQGFGLDVGYKLNPKMEVFVMAIFTDMEGNLKYGYQIGESSAIADDPNTVDFYTIDGGFNYHFTPESRVDFFLGAFAGVFSYDSVTYTLPEIGKEFKVNFDDTFAWGLNAGIDVPFTADGPLFFTATVKYMLTDLKQDGGPNKIGLDPIIGAAGIGFRF